ncbi:MAG: hypothetical protein ABIF77_19900 [bacterium]
MNELPACERFQDLLSRLGGDELETEQAAWLEEHAAGCLACRRVLAIQRHLATPGQSELESAVPEALVRDMWPRLVSRLAAGSVPKMKPVRTWFRQHWYVPLLSAALLVFVFLTGFFLGEVHQFRRHEQDPIKLDQLSHTFAQPAGRSLDVGAERDPAYPLAPAGPGRRWRRAAVAARVESAANLETYLARLPADTELLSGFRLQLLLNRYPQWRLVLGEAGRQAIETTDGLQAGELRRVLQELQFDPAASRLGRQLLSHLPNDL